MQAAGNNSNLSGTPVPAEHSHLVHVCSGHEFHSFTICTADRLDKAWQANLIGRAE